MNVRQLLIVATVQWGRALEQPGAGCKVGRQLPRSLMRLYVCYGRAGGQSGAETYWQQAGLMGRPVKMAHWRAKEDGEGFIESERLRYWQHRAPAAGSRTRA